VITVEEAVRIQQILIEQFGGTSGLRNLELLESALARPYQTFDGQELYLNPEDKAAALLESLVMNHPFLDGNKRIGYVLMRMILLENDLDIDASQDEKYQVIVDVSIGSMKFEQIKNWIKSRLIKNMS